MSKMDLVTALRLVCFREPAECEQKARHEAIEVLYQALRQAARRVVPQARGGENEMQECEWEDAAHRAVVRLLDRTPREDEQAPTNEGAARKYIYTLVRNIYVDMYRQRKRHFLVSLDEKPEKGRQEPDPKDEEGCREIAAPFLDIVKFLYRKRVSELESRALTQEVTEVSWASVLDEMIAYTRAVFDGASARDPTGRGARLGEAFAGAMRHFVHGRRGKPSWERVKQLQRVLRVAWGWGTIEEEVQEILTLESTTDQGDDPRRCERARDLVDQQNHRVLKALADGLVQAGIEPDEARRFIKALTLRPRCQKPTGQRVQENEDCLESEGS